MSGLLGSQLPIHSVRGSRQEATAGVAQLLRAQAVHGHAVCTWVRSVPFMTDALGREMRTCVFLDFLDAAHAH